MLTNIDDTILTAYALNELSAEDFAAVVAHLAEHPEARDQVAEIRAAAEMMTAELGAELASTPALPRAVFRGGPPAVAPGRRNRWATIAIGLAAAAAVAAAAGIYLRSTYPPAGPVISAMQELPPQAFRGRAISSAVPARISTNGGAGTISRASPQYPIPNVPLGQEGNIVTEADVTSIPGMPEEKQRPQGANGQLSVDSAIADANNQTAAQLSTPPSEREARHRAVKSRAIDGLMQDARQDADNGKYTEALDAIKHIKQLDPDNDYANSVTSYLEDKASIQRQRAFKERFDGEHVRQLVDTDATNGNAASRVTSLTQPAAVAVPGTIAANPADANAAGDNTTFRDANGNIVQNATNGSRQLDWVSNVGNAAVPGSIAANPGSLSDVSRLPADGTVRGAENAADQAENTEDAELTNGLDRHLPELRFNANTLSDVVDFLRDVAGVKITVDWDALEKAGISRNTPITERVRDISFRDALSLILKSANTGRATAQPGYKVENGVISISVGPGYTLGEAPAPGESYNPIIDNPFSLPTTNPLSTFAVDVDTASYSNVRRFIEQGSMPPADAVRVAELVNYFPYSSPAFKAGDASPIAVGVEVGECPWSSGHLLARVAMRAKPIAGHEQPASNLVFLIDVSGSMGDANKLPLLKIALERLVNRLSSTDHVAIVTYAGNAAMALPSTPCSDEEQPAAPDEDAANRAALNRMWHEVYEPRIFYRNNQPVNGAEVKADFDKAVANLPRKMVSARDRVLAAIDSLNADGETNGADGIQMAYRTAVGSFVKGGVNRVILATDGDFNVGVTNPDDLVKMIEDKSKSGVYLTVLGMGMGNVKDSTMEKLAIHGKGNYAYLDSLAEADKVLGRQLDSTLITVAKDVKVQVEFNPAKVASYQLIGYEHRLMPKEDFADDQKDGGEMGAGRAVTALYEIIPTEPAAVRAEPLKYQAAPRPTTTKPMSSELMTVSVRYQPPQGGASRKIAVPVQDHPEKLSSASSDFRFASAVAEFGMILRDSPYQGTATLDQVQSLAAAARGEDVGGYRSQFVDLVKRAMAIRGR